jgi:hypothetical protein
LAGKKSYLRVDDHVDAMLDNAFAVLAEKVEDLGPMLTFLQYFLEKNGGFCSKYYQFFTIVLAFLFKFFFAKIKSENWL